MKQNRGLYAGSFDPFTDGHLDVLLQASRLFDEVILVISINEKKKRRTSRDEMKSAIELTLIDLNITNVKVIISYDLTYIVAKNYGADYLIRGLRNETDYAYEENIAKTNEKLAEQLNRDIKTIYFRAGDKSYVSSSMVMELHSYGQDISPWVPGLVLDVINNVF